MMAPSDVHLDASSRHHCAVEDVMTTSVVTADRLTQLFRLPVELERRDGYYHVW